MSVHTFISNLNYGSNIGTIIRTSHIFGKGTKVYIQDENQTLLKYSDEVKRFSVDLSTKHEYELVPDALSFLKKYKGRKIATNLSSKAIPIYNFSFEENDLILFGNERIGLSDEILDISDAEVVIPMFGEPYTKTDYNPDLAIEGVGVYPTFNVSVAHAISLSEAYRQLGYFQDFDFIKQYT